MKPAPDSPIGKIVIAGGGTAGWMAAAVLARALGDTVEIDLVESDSIGTVGVGEATIPQIRLLTTLLGVDECQFMGAVNATIKLGIQFHGWGAPDDIYMHAFGSVGRSLGLLPFYPYWLRARQNGYGGDLWDYSFNLQAARGNRFDRVDRLGDTGLDGLVYAFHFDATLVAAFLRRYSEQRGVRRTEGRIVGVQRDAASGAISALRLDNDKRLGGDLFIDCSGFRALLIGNALGVAYDDWSDWLPCDRAVAQPSERVDPLPPYTQAFARPAGWQWRIPLQQRTGNGHVYCSRHLSDDEALATLQANLNGRAIGDARLLRFRTGMRAEVWKQNCVALGLAAGFMEPLESTSIHLVQSGLQRLLTLFPRRGPSAALSTEYNRQTRNEYERIRDFLILHYHANRRDEPFWRECRAQPLPQPLQRKIGQFRDSGRIVVDADELFTEVAWLQVLIGQGVVPAAYHPLADLLGEEQLKRFLASLRGVIATAVERLPAHSEYIAGHCPAPGEA